MNDTAPGVGAAAPAAPPAGGPTSGIYWARPVPYGYPASIDAAGTVAAPLLAGFSITLIGLILGAADAHAIRLRGEALTALVLAALLLLACVQCAFWARQYTVTPSQIMEWWPDLGLPGDAATERHEQLRGVQWRYSVLAGCWMGRARWTYHVGILALLAGLDLLLVPLDRGASWNSGWSWLSVAVVSLGFMAELYWTVAPGWDKRRLAAKLFPQPSDVMNLPAAQPGHYSGPLPAVDGTSPAATQPASARQ